MYCALKVEEIRSYCYQKDMFLFITASFRFSKKRRRKDFCKKTVLKNKIGWPSLRDVSIEIQYFTLYYLR